MEGLGQDVIFQYDEYLYELQCQVSGCYWTILPQKLEEKARHGIIQGYIY